MPISGAWQKASIASSAIVPAATPSRCAALKTSSVFSRDLDPKLRQKPGLLIRASKPMSSGYGSLSRTNSADGDQTSLSYYPQSACGEAGGADAGFGCHPCEIGRAHV